MAVKTFDLKKLTNLQNKIAGLSHDPATVIAEVGRFCGADIEKLPLKKVYQTIVRSMHPDTNDQSLHQTLTKILERVNPAQDELKKTPSWENPYSGETRASSGHHQRTGSSRPFQDDPFSDYLSIEVPISSFNQGISGSKELIDLLNMKKISAENLAKKLKATAFLHEGSSELKDRLYKEVPEVIAPKLIQAALAGLSGQNRDKSSNDLIQYILDGHADPIKIAESIAKNKEISTIDDGLINLLYDNDDARSIIAPKLVRQASQYFSYASSMGESVKQSTEILIDYIDRGFVDLDTLLSGSAGNPWLYVHQLIAVDDSRLLERACTEKPELVKDIIKRACRAFNDPKNDEERGYAANNISFLLDNKHSAALDVLKELNLTKLEEYPELYERLFKEEPDYFIESAFRNRKDKLIDYMDQGLISSADVFDRIGHDAFERNKNSLRSRFSESNESYAQVVFEELDRKENAKLKERLYADTPQSFVNVALEEFGSTDITRLKQPLIDKITQYMDDGHLTAEDVMAKIDDENLMKMGHLGAPKILCERLINEATDTFVNRNVAIFNSNEDKIQTRQAAHHLADAIQNEQVSADRLATELEIKPFFDVANVRTKNSLLEEHLYTKAPEIFGPKIAQRTFEIFNDHASRFAYDDKMIGFMNEGHLDINDVARDINLDNLLHSFLGKDLFNKLYQDAPDIFIPRLIEHTIERFNEGRLEDDHGHNGRDKRQGVLDTLAKLVNDGHVTPKELRQRLNQDMFEVHAHPRLQEAIKGTFVGRMMRFGR